MKRLKVDKASRAVKSFLRSLAHDNRGVEVELAGQVLCKIIPPSQLSETERAENLAAVRQLLRRSRAHSKGTPAKVIERDIGEAQRKMVRGGR